MFKDLAPLSTHENYQLDPGRGIFLDPRMIIINTLLIKFYLIHGSLAIMSKKNKIFIRTPGLSRVS